MVTHNHMYNMAGPYSTPKLKPMVPYKRVVTTALVAGEENVRTMFLKLGSTKGCQEVPRVENAYWRSKIPMYECK
jgi:hypothetical protein